MRWHDGVCDDVAGVYGVINPAEVDELLFTDDVQEAFDFIVRSLEAGPALWSTNEGNDETPLSTMTS